MKQITLNGSDWTFKEFVGLDWVWRNSVKPDTKDIRWWYPATVPGSVLNDLWQEGKVPNPHYELNSKLVEWVPERTWVYRKSFPTPLDINGKRVTLCFKGIDYSAEIFLNGKKLGRHEGMFIPYEYDITDMLMQQGDNLLAVVLEKAPVEQPQVGKTSLVKTNKTRMNYWWDFCPRMIHQGIWDDVFLKITGQVILKDVYINAKIEDDYNSAILKAEIELNSEIDSEVTMMVNSESKSQLVTGNKVELQMEIKQPKLWQPNGYGEQYRYDIMISVKYKNGLYSDTKFIKYGIRKIEFAANEQCHKDATPFVLKVNGRRIYINGYNWVPIDAMYGVERPQKLHRLIRLAKEANTVMFRVWGGGLIEKDSFYEACAENGILVWQEFIQSSSGIDNKPSEDPEFMDRMASQAEVIIKRKRNHTALAIWCGGNELSDWEGNPVTDADPLIDKLKETVERLDPQRRWLPSSPSGGVFNNNMENILKQPDMLWDVHGPWEHQGLQKHCKLYNMGTSLLHTEFGVEGMTNRNTLNYSVSKENQIPASKGNEIYFHRGAWWTNEPLIQETFDGLDDIDTIRTASQYLQYEGLKYAVECNRRRAFQNSGTFPWQFNEPYPNNYCTSSLDFFANPKPVYYGVRNSYNKILVSASFESPSFFEKQEFVCQIFASSFMNMEEIDEMDDLNLYYELVGIDGSKYYSNQLQCNLPENGTSKVADIKLSMNEINSNLFLLRLKYMNNESNCVAENEYLFTKEKDLGAIFNLDKPKLVFEQVHNNLRIKNNGQTAALFLFLSDDEPLPHKKFLYFDRNYFCLMPNEEKKVTISADSTNVTKLLLAESFSYSENVILL